MPRNENKVKIASTEIECAVMTMCVEDWMTCCLVSPRTLTSPQCVRLPEFLINCMPDEPLSCRVQYHGTACPPPCTQPLAKQNLLHSLPGDNPRGSWLLVPGWCSSSSVQIRGGCGSSAFQEFLGSRAPSETFSKLCNVEPPMESLYPDSAHLCRVGTLEKLSSELLFFCLNIDFGVNCKSTA